MEDKDPKKYVKNLELEDPRVIAKGDLDPAEVKIQEDVEQAFINAKTLVSFVSEVTGQHRSDVLNSVLLAQLAANKKFPEEEQTMNWYKEFVHVLNNTGWAIDSGQFNFFEADGTVFELQNTIIDILTAAFGGPFMTVITKTLDAIKALSDSDGKIIAFERNTHTLTKGAFQIGLAKEVNGVVSLTVGTFMLTSTSQIRQILFFRSTSDKTRLDHASGTGTLSDDIYGQIRSAVVTKLGDKVTDFIAEIDIS